MRRPNLLELWKHIARPVELSALALIVLGILLMRQILQPGQWIAILMIGGATTIYVLVFLRWLLPRYARFAWLHWMNMILTIIFLSAILYITGLQVEIFLLYLLISVVHGMLLGVSASIIASLLAFAGTMIALHFRGGLNDTILIAGAFQVVVYSLAGYMTAGLSDTITRQNEETEQRNRSLALLLEMSALSDTLNLEESLPRLARQIVQGLSSSFCIIQILDNATGELVTQGTYPARPKDTLPPVNQRRLLSQLPWHRKAVETHQMVIVRQDVPALAMDDQERSAMVFDDLQSACIVPMVFEKRVLGVISVGEERRWEREPFDRSKINLLSTIAAQTAVVINNARLHLATRKQVERMAVINEVTRAISSTIEMDDLLEKIYEQIRLIIPAETYFVGLYNQRDNFIDMVVVIDDGERFPPDRFPLGEGLSSYVIKSQTPLLVRHLSEERETLPALVNPLGAPRESESWLGVPIPLIEGHGGVLTVASYQPNAFDEDDVALLSNIATQAALALDNARHHAEVEEQSRRDSLTQVYNHSYFLKRLNQEIENAEQNHTPVSMIMLDIDHFKKYNDTYGHVTGDEVLNMVVYSIQANTKPSDVVGRWGGEEFGIVMPGKTTREAFQTAESIRETLASLPVFDNTGNGIPAPTISQGIATYPTAAGSASKLVDIADRALYQAKEKGRDQIQAIS